MLFKPKDDGITHINIYSRGATALGRVLSNFEKTPIHLPFDGYFASIEAYWYWLATGKIHDDLRPLYGYRAKKTGMQYTRQHIDHFEDHIKRAFMAKVQQNDDVWWLLMVSHLPLTHYFVKDDFAIPLKRHQWQVDFWANYRHELQGP